MHSPTSVWSVSVVRLLESSASMAVSDKWLAREHVKGKYSSI